MGNSTNESMSNTDNSMAESVADHSSVSKTVSSNSCRVGGSSIVGHLSDVSLSIVGAVVDVLDTAVREVDRVGALSGSSAVISLGSIKSGAGVVISHGVLVGVGGDLIRVHLHGMGHSMAHNTMGNTMAKANTMANANSMAEANTKTNSMANAGAMANADTMANTTTIGDSTNQANTMAYASHKSMSSHKASSSHEAMYSHKASPQTNSSPDSVGDGMRRCGLSDGGSNASTSRSNAYSSYTMCHSSEELRCRSCRGGGHKGRDTEESLGSGW